MTHAYHRLFAALLLASTSAAYAQMPPSGLLTPRAVGNINQQIAQNKAQAVTLPGAPIVNIPAPPRQNTQGSAPPNFGAGQPDSPNMPQSPTNVTPPTPSQPPVSNVSTVPITPPVTKVPSAPVVVYGNSNEPRADYYRDQNAKNEAQFGAQYHNLNSIHPSNFPKNQPVLGFAISERQNVVAHIQKAKSFGISEGKIELELATRSTPNFIAWVERVTAPMN